MRRGHDNYTIGARYLDPRGTLNLQFGGGTRPDRLFRGMEFIDVKHFTPHYPIIIPSP